MSRSPASSPWRRLLAPAACLLALSLHAAPVGTPEALLPADTVLALHVRDVATLGERLKASPVGRHYDAPEGQVLRDALAEFLDEPFYFAELELTNREVIGLVPGSWVVAFRLPEPTAAELEPDDSGEIPFVGNLVERFEMILLGEYEDRAPVLEAIEAADARIARDNPDRRIDTIDHAGTTIYTDSLVGEDGEAVVGSAYAVTDRWQVFAERADTVRDVVDALADSASGPRLASQVGWSVVEDRSADAEFTLFVNLAHLGKIADKVLRALPNQQQFAGMGMTSARLADTLRLDALGGLHVGAAASGERLVVDSSFEASEWAGILRLLQVGPLRGLPHEAPPGVDGANAIAFDVGASVAELRKLVAEAAPGAAALLDMQIASAKEQAGIDLEAGLLSNLGTYELQVMHLDPKARAAASEAEGDGEPDAAAAAVNPQVFKVTLRDGTAFLGLIEQVKALQPGLASLLVPREIGGAQAFDFVPPTGPGPAQIAFAVRGNALYVSVGSNALLDRVLTQREGDPTAWSEPQVRRLLEEAPSDAIGVGVVRLAGLADLVLSTINRGAEGVDEADAAKLRQVAELVRAALQPLVGVSWATKEGNLIWQRQVFVETEEAP